MVEQNRSGAYTQIIYAPGGQKFALMNGQTLQKAFAPLPGGGTAVYNSSGLLYYAHADHLGSVRFASTPSRTMYFDLAHAPFGEVYASSGNIDPAFTGQRQDTSSGLYDFAYREYSITGRGFQGLYLQTLRLKMFSPDPAGVAAVSLDNPQSWNRYAYVSNSPLSAIDPLGFEMCSAEFSYSACGGDGGFWGGGSFGDSVGYYDREYGGLPPDVAEGMKRLDSIRTTNWDPALQIYYGDASQYILISCTGPGDGAWDCSPVGAYARYLAPGWRPYSTQGNVYDQRAITLGRALNKTGVQSLNNPCTVVGFYAISATGGVIAGAAAGGEVFDLGMGAASAYWPQTLNSITRWLYIQSIGGFPLARTITNFRNNIDRTKAAVSSGCSALQ